MGKKKAKIVRKAGRPKKQYIVVWDNDDGDPVKVFDSMEDAKKFAVALITGDEDYLNETFESDYWDTDSIIKDSVKLYEGTLLGKAKIAVSFEA